MINRIALLLAFVASTASAQTAKIPINYILTTSSSVFSMNGGKITGLATPTLSTDAVNKSYADSLTCSMCVLTTRAINTTSGQLTGGGTLASNLTIGLATTAVTAGNYTNTNLAVDAYGRITAASNGSAGAVTSVTATTPVVSSGGTTPVISLATSGVTAASYGSSTTVPTFTVNAKGLVTAAANVAIASSGVTSIVAGTNITITSTGGGGTGAVTVNASSGGGHVADTINALTSDYTINTTSDFASVLTMNSTSSHTITFPTLSSGDIGKWFTIVKINTGNLVVQMPSGTTVRDSSAGGTISNIYTNQIWSTLKIEIISTTQMVVVGADGTWVTL